jgi:DNA-binding transcriptional LysR family regulator
MLDWDNLRIFLELTRSQNLVDAAKKLGIDHSTVSRRMRKFEEQVGTQLFERNNSGYVFTSEGSRLMEYAERIESAVYAATQELGEHNRILSGQVRLGATEGFGSFVLASHLANFCARHPHISVDLIAVPRFVNLSKREADLVVTIERPQTGPYVVTKLTDYRLKLYATQKYLDQHEPIKTLQDLTAHPMIGYVDDLLFSSELRYIDSVAPDAFRSFRSTSITAQYNLARQGHALAILPCFLAQQCDDLVPLLDTENGVNLVRTFWLVSPSERRHLTRVTALWDYIRAAVELNREFLMGETSEHIYLAE